MFRSNALSALKLPSGIGSPTLKRRNNHVGGFAAPIFCERHCHICHASLRLALPRL